MAQLQPQLVFFLLFFQWKIGPRCYCCSFSTVHSYSCQHSCSYLRLLQQGYLCSVSKKAKNVQNKGKNGYLVLKLVKTSTYVHKLRKGKQIQLSSPVSTLYACIPIRSPFLLSLYSYVLISIPLSISIYPYLFIPTLSSLSIFRYPFIHIPLSLSIYPNTFIPLSLSLSLY